MGTDLICIGCGVTLQTEDKEALGYIPAAQLNKTDLVCKRCFQLRHYNKQQPVSLESDDFLQLVSQVSETDSLVVHLVDIFDVDGTLLKSLPRIVGNNPILLVGNKVDLLPKSTNLHKLKKWLFSMAKEVGLKVLDVF